MKNRSKETAKKTIYEDQSDMFERDGCCETFKLYRQKTTKTLIMNKKKKASLRKLVTVVALTWLAFCSGGCCLSMPRT